MRIGLITTLNRNIGDDFIRDGIIQVLRAVYDNHEVNFVQIDKHRPFTVYPAWHPLRWVQVFDRLPRGRRAAEKLKELADSKLHGFGGSVFDKVDLIAQCGAPVMWPGCHKSEWATPLWDRVVGRIHERIPVLNLAVGSAYPWEDQPRAVRDRRDAEFLTRILGYCRLTTARDDLASHLGGNLGVQVPVIPCSAFLVGRRFEATRSEDGPVLFNCMAGAGHFEWSQGIDPGSWERVVGSLIERLSNRHTVVFVCHDAQEYSLARRLAPDLDRFLPTSVEEYFGIVSSAKAGLCNRLHASVGMAGLGIPSVSVGTDSRMLMVDALGLPVHFVKDVTVDQLEHEIENVIDQRKVERERLLELRLDTWEKYVEATAEAIER